MRRLRVLIGLLLISTWVVIAQAGPFTLRSSENQVALLELFTSEGCSSCPPAESWLSDLKNSKRLWKDFVPIAFHVDYWDYLGWPDRWAAKAFSDRQHRYAQTWQRESVYTPEFVLNGKEWRAWSRPKEGPSASAEKVGIVSMTSTDLRHWQASFAPSVRESIHYELHAALLTSDLVSDVKAGENAGRRLNHDFVATRITTSVLKGGKENPAAEFELMPEKANTSRLAIVVWVTETGSLIPIQALGSWLP